MARKGRLRLRLLAEVVAQLHPNLQDPAAVIKSGNVAVDGVPVTNPRSLVRPGASVRLRRKEPLRGEAKLRAALAAFGVDVHGRVALDAGAAAGGFTRTLLTAGAARIFAVDAGFGQLAGSLRQDARVVNLERTNIAELNRRLVPESIDLITVDLSYLPLAIAVPQLAARVDLAEDAALVALVKPQFELGLAAPPTTDASLQHALASATAGAAAAGFDHCADIPSPVRGSRGAVEFLLHARRRGR